MTSDADSPDEPKQGAKSREVFSVYSSVSGKVETFEDPRVAGRAFFLADPAERPSVTHMVGNSVRTMARTEVHGSHQSGEPKYFKSLPSSHAPDAKFREGFLEAMEQSLKERLGKVAAVEGPAQEARVDTRLLDDLESLAYRAPATAAELWGCHRADHPSGTVLKAAVDAHAVGVSRGATVAQTGETKISGANIRLPEKTLRAKGSSYNLSSEDWER